MTIKCLCYYYVIDLNKLEFKYSSMRSKYHSVNNLKVSEELLLFVNNELFNGTDISPEKFWKDFDKAVHELAPKNKELIDFRETLQKKIDKWHIENKGKNFFLFLTYSNIHTGIMKEVLQKYDNFSEEYFSNRKRNEEFYDGLFNKADEYLGSMISANDRLDKSSGGLPPTLITSSISPS